MARVTKAELDSRLQFPGPRSTAAVAPAADDEDHDICYKQPENEEELEQCYEAMENCPVEAIGDDGDA